MTESVRAVRAPVQIGSLTVDGFMLPDGSYRMSQTQIAEAVGLSRKNVSDFLRSNALKSLLGEDYTPQTFEIEPAEEQLRGQSRINALPLAVVRTYWLWQASRGNKQALALVEAVMTEALERRFDEAFGITRTEQERNELLSQRVQEPERNIRETFRVGDEVRLFREYSIAPWGIPGTGEKEVTITIPSQPNTGDTMIQTQTITKTFTFDEFAAWYPENSVKRYELHNGVIVEMPLGTGRHSVVTGFTRDEISAEIRRLKLPYFIPGDCLLKPTRDEAGYQPDVIVLDEAALHQCEPRWDRESIITMGSSVRLAVEVVSTNWRDDYFFKASDYEEMGIPEYWMVDYLGLGGRKFIGSPKQPTLSVCFLVDGEYQVKQFRGDDTVESLAFPELRLTAEVIFRAGLPAREP